jgi:hypothetical protein
VSTRRNGSWQYYGAHGFNHTAPTGFKSICSKNLPNPVLSNPSSVIDVVLYEGTGSELEISDFSFAPDFIWIKKRTATGFHVLCDSKRGATNLLYTNSEVDEDPQAQSIKSFNTNGITLGTGGSVNDNGEDFVCLGLKLLASTCGFDMQLYEGTAASQTLDHNLGRVPKMMWSKSRDDDEGWTVYHYAALNKTDPETDRGILSRTNIWADGDTAWNDTAPTSTEFTVGTGWTNNNGSSHIMYLFADIPGLTKVFTYEGNGNAAGPFVYCGFRPLWILIKNADSDTTSWRIIDAVRNQYNPVINTLYADTNDAESTNSTVDFYSNGFKILDTDLAYNGNNNTMIGVAFAEQPFKYSNAR